MSTLYIDRKLAELRCSNRQIVIRHGCGRPSTFPFAMVERIVVTQNLRTDTASLSRIAAAGIPIALIHSRGDAPLVSIAPLPGNDPRRRLEQYALWHDPTGRAVVARALLQIKVRRQYRLARRMANRRPDQRYILERTITTLRESMARLNDPETHMDSLRGIEGAASAALFRALAAVLPPALEFTTRKRRPPPDPANALLSLGYTLAHGLAAEAAHAAGLDPAIGFLHEPLAGRHSLASDLMEPLRPLIEELVWRLFRERLLTAGHFHKRDGACRLGKAGRAIFFGEWEHRTPHYRRWLRRATRTLVNHLEGPEQQ